MPQLALFEEGFSLEPADDLAERAREFCARPPHRFLPYSRRDWGGPLHSLCSYQGKLKPAIAHFLVSWFTQPGDRVLDPLCGVGTVPLEARRLGRVGIGNDLSPLATSVTRAKVEPFSPDTVDEVIQRLSRYIAAGPSLAVLEARTDLGFGLNGPIREYFHPDTLREVVLAREFLRVGDRDPATDIVRASLLHILHGNRPYALSRRSHPVTPFAPSGRFEYRPLVIQLRRRLQRVLPELLRLAHDCLPGIAIEGDFRDIELEQRVDAVITSPPFTKSLRFWSSNWMRLWFAGWDPQDFTTEPARYLETEQRSSFEPYGALARVVGDLLRPGGVFGLHLGETASSNMVAGVLPELGTDFEVVFVGREGVEDTESHGLRDKGATTAHWYVFAVRR